MPAIDSSTVIKILRYHEEAAISISNRRTWAKKQMAATVNDYGTRRLRAIGLRLMSLPVNLRADGNARSVGHGMGETPAVERLEAAWKTRRTQMVRRVESVKGFKLRADFRNNPYCTKCFSAAFSRISKNKPVNAVSKGVPSVALTQSSELHRRLHPRSYDQICL